MENDDEIFMALITTSLKKGDKLYEVVTVTDNIFKAKAKVEEMNVICKAVSNVRRLRNEWTTKYYQDNPQPDIFSQHAEHQKWSEKFKIEYDKFIEPFGEDMIDLLNQIPEGEENEVWEVRLAHYVG
jgi:hypothetical protein